MPRDESRKTAPGPVYTRASPRRSPRTPKTPVVLTGSSLSKKSNFYLIAPRQVRITKKARLEAETYKAQRSDSKDVVLDKVVKITSLTPKMDGGRHIGTPTSKTVLAMKAQISTPDRAAQSDKDATILHARIVIRARRPRITRADRLASEAAAK